MAEPINESAASPMTPAEFKTLATTDINKWLTLFLGGFDRDEDDIEDERDDGEEDVREELAITQADEYSYFDKEQTTLGLYIVEVHDEGGYEGAGEHAEKVFAVCDEDDNEIAFFRITGYYNSYDGTEWSEEVTAVQPREVMVTQYFNIDGSEDA